MAATRDRSAVDGSAATHDLVERFVAAVWNGAELAAIEDLTTDDVVVHALGAGVDRTREAFVSFHEGLLAAVPDLDHTVEDVLVDGDRAVARVTIRGTPERQYGALSPTGESFEAAGFQQYRIEDGQIAEVWVLPNAMGMLRQLGTFPDGPGDVLALLFRAAKGRVLGR